MKPIASHILLFPILLFLSYAGLAQDMDRAGDAVRSAGNQAAHGTFPEAEWLAHAAMLERSQDWQGLRDWGLRWTDSAPEDATAWFVLGRAFSELKQYPEAIDAYRKDLRIEPGDVYALNNLGNAYRDSRHFHEAMETYREAVRINPDYLLAWHNLGLTFYDLKGVSGVSQALKQLRASDPDLAEAWRKLVIEYSLSRDEQVEKKAIAVLRGLGAAKRQRMFEILFAEV